MIRVSSWGRLSALPHDCIPLVSPQSAGHVVTAHPGGIPFGMGRSYGDVCLNPGGVLWHTGPMDRFIRFDPGSGRLHCEAGTLLGDIQRLFVPRGWMLPATPGTQLVTVGGAIANDVHGKNHHAVGSFGDHVVALRLLRTDGTVIDCGPDRDADWFAATVGGMGLTGVILTAELQLKRTAGPWLETETIPFHDLGTFFKLADSSEQSWEHTVAWIDCVGTAMGRGIFMRGNTAARMDREEPSVRPHTMPFVPPVSLVNRLSLRPFNAAYFSIHKLKAGKGVSHYQRFFYPLDHLLEWNRMYGPRGFYQYQCVVPREGGESAVQGMLAEISRSGQGSFLAVLKTFGKRQAVGMMSFPMPGVTLALDFPNNGARTLALFDRLDAVVRAAGGRLYCAKDARMPRDLFESGYPRLAEFVRYRDRGISSALSRRLMGF